MDHKNKHFTSYHISALKTFNIPINKFIMAKDGYYAHTEREKVRRE